MKVRKDWNFKRAQVVILWKNGRSVRDFAEIIRFSKSTVQRTIVRFEQRGDYNELVVQNYLQNVIYEY